MKQKSKDMRDTLREVLEERGFKQGAIAKKAGLTSAKLSSILSKCRKLEVHEMLEICKAIQIEPEDLIQRNKAS